MRLNKHYQASALSRLLKAGPSHDNCLLHDQDLAPKHQGHCEAKRCCAAGFCFLLIKPRTQHTAAKPTDPGIPDTVIQSPLLLQQRSLPSKRHLGACLKVHILLRQRAGANESFRALEVTTRSLPVLWQCLQQAKHGTQRGPVSSSLLS